MSRSRMPIDYLEPDALNDVRPVPDIVAASVAISAKRQADALEAGADRIRDIALALDRLLEFLERHSWEGSIQTRDTGRKS